MNTQQRTEFKPRQTERRQAKLQFDIGGVDARGEFFEETILTFNIGEGGGCFDSSRQIPLGATMKLADSGGFLSLVSIVWGSKKDKDQPTRYGFKFVQPFEG